MDQPQPSILSRRSLLHAGAGLGGLAVAGTMVGCASNAAPANKATSSAPTLATSDDNPFGYDPATAGSIVIPLGGYKDGYLVEMIAAFKALHAGADITHEMVEDQKIKMQPRVAQGDMPDLWNVQGMDSRTLGMQGHFAVLDDVLEAPALDGGKVGDHLVEGWQTSATLSAGEELLAFPTSLSVRGLWYSGKLFRDKGWEVPRTWPELLALCEEMVSAGIAPFTYGGTVDYTTWPTYELAVKEGGQDFIDRVAAMDPTVWTSDAVRAAAEAITELRKRGFILSGSEGLNHTESQTYWAQGEAALIPVGGWVENESADVIPDDFEPMMMPVPALREDGALPPEAVGGSYATNWTIPAKGANPAFAKEFTRFMLSKEGARIWYKNTLALSSLNPEWTADLATTTGQQSQIDMLAKAGPNFYSLRPPTSIQIWRTDAADLCNRLWGGSITPDEFCEGMQTAMEKTAAAADA
jgi:N-acetylglucosamine transport system substrate-binding protein